MREKEIKKRVRAAFDSEAPDLRSKIEESCSKGYQAPRFSKVEKRSFGITKFGRCVMVCSLCVSLFISGTIIGAFNIKDNTEQEENAPSSVVYLDVNPSVELQLTSDDKIYECNPLNDDAEIILGELELEGVELNTALTAIVGSMYINGYLSDDMNSILVSVNSEDELKTDKLLNLVSEKINGIFESSQMECAIIAQNIEINDALKQKADEYGVSVGKMSLVEKTVSVSEKLADEDVSELSDMSIGDLNFIYVSNYDKENDNHSHGKDVIHGKPNGYLTDKDALALVMNKYGFTTEDIDEFEIEVGYARGDHRRVLYYVEIELKDSSELDFTVDPISGDILLSDEDKPENDRVDEKPLPEIDSKPSEEDKRPSEPEREEDPEYNEGEDHVEKETDVGCNAPPDLELDREDGDDNKPSFEDDKRPPEFEGNDEHSFSPSER